VKNRILAGFEKFYKMALAETIAGGRLTD